MPGVRYAPGSVPAAAAQQPVGLGGVGGLPGAGRRWRRLQERAAARAALSPMHSARPPACDARCLTHIPGGALRRGPEEAAEGKGGQRGGRNAGGAEPKRGGAAGAVRAAPRREGRPLPPAAASGERRGPGGRRGRAPARSYCRSQRAPAMALARTHARTHAPSLAHNRACCHRPPPSVPAHPSAAAGTRRLIGARRCRRDSRERKGSAAGGGEGGGGSRRCGWRPFSPIRGPGGSEAHRLR